MPPHKIFSTAVENDFHFTIALHGYRLRRLATLQIQVRAQTARKLFTLNYTKYFTTRQHNVFNTKQPVDEFLISPAVYPYNGKVWD